MFMSLKSLKIRNTLSSGLIECLDGKIEGDTVKKEVREVVGELNKLKRGLADMELDYDRIIKTIQQLLEVSLDKFTQNELHVMTYPILFLLQSEEFSVRDYASHFLKHLFSH